MAETYTDISNKAKGLVESAPQEAYDLYVQLLNDFNEEFSGWDAFNLMKVARKIHRTNFKLLVEVTERFKDENKVTGLFSWFVFDKYVKKKNHSEVLQNEVEISKMLTICPQKDMKSDDTYPCPVTISVFTLVDAHANNLFNARKIKELLGFVDKDKLSPNARTINTEKRGDIKLASDYEKYYANLTKALLKLEEYQECLDLCEEALNELENNFHYNNDLWFKMRIALCYEGLDDFEKGEQLFKELIESKAGGDKWFLYRDIAELYYEKEDYDKSYKYSIDSALLGNEPHFLINLYLLQARLLFKLGKVEEGKIYAQLIASILKEQEWNVKAEHSKIIKYYQVTVEDAEPVNKIHKKAKSIWLKEKYKDKAKLDGIVDVIHKNGKSGFIKSNEGETFFFGKRDLLKSVRRLDEILKAKVSFYEGDSNGKNKSANAVEVIELNKEKLDDLIGSKHDGVVTKVVDFGLFVGGLKNGKYGLVHAKKLPSDFEHQFTKGQKVTVEVTRITKKNELELKLII